MVSATTRWAMEGSSFAMRERRVLSRRSPSTPSATKRSCQRQTQVLDLPVSRMIAFVPRPSALSSTICTRHSHVLLRRVAVLDQIAKPIKVGGRDGNRNPGAHATDSHAASLSGISTGIQILDAIH